ncbi:MAG: 1-acyl-sn-glycerol-3-phosphate acyltransferase [Longimicrobiales bacterium]
MHASNFITRLVGWTASIFYQLERAGGPIPGGPVLVVANHPNSLLDPLIVFRVAGRPTRPLAKAPLFDQMFVGTMLRGLGGLPVYRRQDDAEQMHRNEDTFRLAIAALRAGDAVQIYPEGTSHSEPGLVPLRTGAARIALGAEADSEWSLGLQIVPVGLTYRRKNLFRGRALAVIGEAFDVDPFRDVYDSDSAQAVRALTDEIARRLQTVTLNLTRSEDQELVETAEALYTRVKGIAGWREREPLADRLPRLQEFARGLAWVRAHDAPRYERLAAEVRRYARRLQLFGASDAEVPPKYAAPSVLRYLIREAPLVILGVPLAAAAAILWYPPYLAPRIAVRMIRPEHEAVATYKLATAFFVMPLWCALCAFLAWRVAGPVAGVVTASAVPALGFFALAWRERWARVREDVRLFFRVLRHPRKRDRLAAQRNALAREFDEILKHMRAPPELAAH